MMAAELSYSALGHRFAFRQQGTLHKGVELKQLNLRLGTKLECVWDSGDGYPWRTVHSPDDEFIVDD